MSGSPQKRPFRHPRTPNARLLSDIPLAELPAGKRVRSLNSGWTGSISEHGEHEGKPTLSIAWDNGKAAPGISIQFLNVIEEQIQTEPAAAKA